MQPRAGNRKYIKHAHWSVPVRILRRYVHDVPSLDVERAIYFTRSMKQTEGEPLVLRWAKALRHIVENITVYIAEDQLLAGQAGGPGRHAIVYPEIDGPHLAEVFRGNRTLGHSFTLTDEDKSRGDREIVDYWKERGYLAQFYRGLPEDIRPIIFVKTWKPVLLSSKMVPMFLR